jgi:diacylglycerol kinase (ATP)
MMPARPRLSVLVNASARHSSRSRWRAALSELQGGAEVTVAFPATPEAMHREARGAVADGADGVVVMGGDGTVNCVANALAGSATPLGIIPRGTGNDFAAALGIPADPVAAAGRVLAGRVRAVDLIAVDGRLFCTAGIVGVPAAAALTVRRWFSPGARTRPLIHVLGGFAYTLAGLRHLLSPALRSRTYRITSHAGGMDLTGYGVFAANMPMLGGGLVLPVGSDGSDGVMEIVGIRGVPRWRLLQAFVCFARGWPLPDGILTTLSAREATLTCASEEPFAADGDLLDRGTTFHLVVRPGALRVIA